MKIKIKTVKLTNGDIKLLSEAITNYNNTLENAINSTTNINVKEGCYCLQSALNELFDKIGK